MMTNKFNKITSFFIALMLLLSLSACGGSGGREPKTTPDAAETDNTDAGEQQEPSDTPAADNTDESIDDADEEDPQDSAEIDIPPQSAEPTAEQPVASGGDEETTTADSVVALAQSLIGAAYEWGAAGPDTFDNSGFVYYCFKENGITLPRKTSEMFASGTPVEQEDLLPGDLVFFTYNDDRSASYVGIYIGGGQFIAENNEDRPVSIHDMTLDYYTKIYVGARRYS